MPENANPCWGWQHSMRAEQNSRASRIRSRQRVSGNRSKRAWNLPEICGTPESVDSRIMPKTLLTGLAVLTAAMLAAVPAVAVELESVTASAYRLNVQQPAELRYGFTSRRRITGLGGVALGCRALRLFECALELDAVTRLAIRAIGRRHYWPRCSPC